MSARFSCILLPSKAKAAKKNVIYNKKSVMTEKPATKQKE
jgi:hypothetical protein